MKKIIFTFISITCLAQLSAQLKVNSLGEISNTNAALTFKVNNVVAGFTGYGQQSNASFGYASLSNQSGTYNTAIGGSALYYNTSGSRNTATGACALYLNMEGNFNTANGCNALISNISGEYNSAVGYSALQSNTEGSFNTGIGYHAGACNPINLTNSTALGYGATVTASNQVVLGNTTVTSIIGGSNISLISDMRAKKNIKADVPGLDFINLLQPVTYHLDLDVVDHLLGIDKVKKDKFEKDMPQYLKDINEKARKTKEEQVQTGFLAQDVEKTAKSIGYDFSGVNVDEKGIYSLSYAEFVVPLVKAVQELSEQNKLLQQQINELKGSNAALRAASNETGTTGIVNPVIAQCKLSQNAPNPFTNQTEIKYFLATGVKNASICIFDMQGKMLQKINAANGQNSILIEGSSLQAGIYLYSLIADGQEVDTKRMILTK